MIVILSDKEQGAQVVVYCESGEQVAASGGGPGQSLATPDRGGAFWTQWIIGVAGGANPRYRRHRWVLPYGR